MRVICTECGAGGEGLVGQQVDQVVRLHTRHNRLGGCPARLRGYADPPGTGERFERIGDGEMIRFMIAGWVIAIAGVLVGFWIGNGGF